MVFAGLAGTLYKFTYVFKNVTVYSLTSFTPPSSLPYAKLVVFCIIFEKCISMNMSAILANSCPSMNVDFCIIEKCLLKLPPACMHGSPFNAHKIFRQNAHYGQIVHLE
jgi:hypothetical protein